MATVTAKVNGIKPSSVKNLFTACINLRWPETGDQEEAISFILSHPKIKRKIDFEAKRLSTINDEFDRKELRTEIVTLLYLAIKNEFNLQLDPNRMEGWLCSRIAWRTLDHIYRECDLVYAKDKVSEEAEYSRIEKIPLDKPPMFGEDRDAIGERVELTTRNTQDVVSSYSTNGMSLGDMIPADIEKHQTFESFLRKSPIKTQHKHVLMYVITMGYSFQELADIYRVSTPTARKLYNQAVMSIKRHILGLSHAEQQSVHGLLSHSGQSREFIMPARHSRSQM
jgi:hypothetical protein